MSYNKEKMLFHRTPRDVILSVNLPCSFCGNTGDIVLACPQHNASVEDVPIKVVGIPWAKLNYIKSQAVSFNDDKTYYDGQFYINECLKQMVIEAPWGKTDDLFLLQIDKPLGEALEKIIPKANSSDLSPKKQDYNEIKKE